MNDYLGNCVFLLYFILISKEKKTRICLNHASFLEKKINQARSTLLIVQPRSASPIVL